MSIEVYIIQIQRIYIMEHSITRSIVRIYPNLDYKQPWTFKGTQQSIKMRFIVLIAFLALIAGVFMEEKKHVYKKQHKHLKKYFHKKMCYCLKHKKGICKVLKCCDIYKYVPYKVFIKVCKFGKCKFVKKHYHKKEKHAGVSAQSCSNPLPQLIPCLCLFRAFIFVWWQLYSSSYPLQSLQLKVAYHYYLYIHITLIRTYSMYYKVIYTGTVLIHYALPLVCISVFWQNKPAAFLQTDPIFRVTMLIIYILFYGQLRDSQQAPSSQQYYTQTKGNKQLCLLQGPQKDQ
eukprot:TRINITY_DN869_c0_g3_i10.p3 TRINITY_DN869_c0_g3~~TRINITY_DN869_c0_g3_i10.p3  ORF type:complete len:288 (+),score=-8.56 TRINITY_DN869_c0_g3_i10:404-1267(+)